MNSIFICLTWVFFILTIGFTYGCASPTTLRGNLDPAAIELEAEKQREVAVLESIRNQKLVSRVAWPILKAGEPLCVDKKRWAIGSLVVTKNDYPEDLQKTVVSVFNIEEKPKVLLIVKDTPADKAGLREGDTIISINSQPIPTGKEASQNFYKKISESGSKGQFVNLDVERGGKREKLSLKTEQICDYPVLVVQDDSVNAFADGNNIFIARGMLDFVKTDEELSLVISHELAHNNMRHIDSKRANAIGGAIVDILIAALTGVNTQGAFSNAAASAYSQEFEQEADYVGLYMLAMANMDIEEAPYFWRRMAIKSPQAIEKNYGSSHPSTPERFVLLKKTIDEINSKKATKITLLPNIDENQFMKREVVGPNTQTGFSVK